eukprot:Gb_33792 [translate_table: standard]
MPPPALCGGVSISGERISACFLHRATLSLPRTNRPVQNPFHNHASAMASPVHSPHFGFSTANVPAILYSQAFNNFSLHLSPSHNNSNYRMMHVSLMYSVWASFIFPRSALHSHSDLYKLSNI